jgi:hypothetical protein
MKNKSDTQKILKQVSISVQLYRSVHHIKILDWRTFRTDHIHITIETLSKISRRMANLNHKIEQLIAIAQPNCLVGNLQYMCINYLILLDNENSLYQLENTIKPQRLKSLDFEDNPIMIDEVRYMSEKSIF